MRAHRFRPVLDRLDSRLLLDASDLTGATPQVTQIVLCSGDSGSTGMMPGEEIDGTSTWNWVVAGAPPAPTYDLSSPPVDPVTVTSTVPSS
jgi:hypothetical protein